MPSFLQNLSTVLVWPLSSRSNFTSLLLPTFGGILFWQTFVQHPLVSFWFLSVCFSLLCLFFRRYIRISLQDHLVFSFGWLQREHSVAQVFSLIFNSLSLYLVLIAFSSWLHHLVVCLSFLVSYEAQLLFILGKTITFDLWTSKFAHISVAFRIRAQPGFPWFVGLVPTFLHFAFEASKFIRSLDLAYPRLKRLLRSIYWQRYVLMRDHL